MPKEEVDNKTTLLCPQTKRFESIYVCAINCTKRCQKYLDNVCFEILEEFIALHPEYEIKGELMAVSKKETNAKKEKVYWVIDEDNQIEEVEEQEIFDNPQKYLDKEIWDKPPFKYEIVVTLKRKKQV